MPFLMLVKFLCGTINKVKAVIFICFNTDEKRGAWFAGGKIHNDYFRQKGNSA